MKLEHLKTIFTNKIVLGTFAVSGISGVCGKFGARKVKVFITTIDEGAVGLTCALVPLITMSIAFFASPSKDQHISNYISPLILGCLASYPLSLGIANLKGRVHVLHPVVAIMASMGMLMVAAAIMCSCFYFFQQSDTWFQ